MVSDTLNIKDLLDVTFRNLGDDSRVWIWQSATLLDEQQASYFQNAIKSFMARWVSHNQALKAEAGVFYNQFVVVMLDQTASSSASGCSIDSLTHEVTDIAKVVGVDVLDRTKFCFLREEGVDTIAMSDLKAQGITNSDLVFDNLVKSKAELYTVWLKPVKESWHRRFI